MEPGTIVGGRFAIESVAGTGGMGTVFRAVDSASGATIALKVLRGGPAAHGHAERFLREARVLAELSHPAIVRYVAHGIADDGAPFLAMEWLDGEDLEHRLARGALPVADAIAVVRAAAEGLAVAHARGVVHRDVKPANLFLVGGDPRRVKVLDFGIARRDEGSRAMTRTGAVMGTAGYMAPEQARGLRELDARADVFALGCVLFEALSGRAAFVGEHFVAVLAKVLLDDPPRLSTIVASIPERLDALVAAMLAKDPSARPSDATAVIDALGDPDAHAFAAPTSASPAAAVSSGEQRLVSAILVARARAVATDATLPASSDADQEGLVREVAARFGATLAMLADGTLLLSLSGKGSAPDQAARAAACAQALGVLGGDTRIALATGRAETSGAWPVGPVIDRAAAILSRGLGTGEIRVDELTERLLEARYVVVDGVLGRARADGEHTRTLLGRPTPCVGRDKELALLSATFAECIDEPAARAALVIAPPGVGKSRLIHELLRRVGDGDGASILVARMDPVSAGSALAIARQLIVSAANAKERPRSGDLLERIRGRVEAVGTHDAARVTEFLGELAGAQTTDELTPRMRAARHDVHVMGEWIRRSFLEWLSAECAARPVLVVIEDLHWGDGTSVGYLDEVLRANARRPLMVLATGRPETAGLFPDAWAASGAQTVRLGGLPRRAAERLARLVLGEGHTDTDIARVVDRADGNAFYLEELVRSVVETKSAELPETVLAMAQARLDALEPEARRVLRAASVFGERFWRNGVGALLGGVDAGEWLEVLARREVLVRSEGSRLAGEEEYAFRHGLLREAAYASLPRSELAPAHRRAGEWLEAVGEREARVLAEHFERGEVADRAVYWLRFAALRALNGRELHGAAQLAGRALAFDPEPAIAGGLFVIKGMAGAWIGDWDQARIFSERGLALVPRGSTGWYSAASGVMWSAARTGQTSTVETVALEVLAQAEPAEASGPYANAMYAMILSACESGAWDAASALWSRLDAVESTTRSDDVAFAAWREVARYLRSVYDAEREDLGALRGATEASALFDAAGDAGGAMLAGSYRLSSTSGLHGREEDIAAVREALVRGHSLRDTGVFNHAVMVLARALVFAGRPLESLEVLLLAEGTKDASFATFVVMTRALALECGGRHEEAAGEARRALDRSAEGISVGASVTSRVVGHAILARQALRDGRAADALASADAAITLGTGAPCFAIEMHAARLVRAEALHALGRRGEALDAILDLRARFLRTASTAPEQAMRATYLRECPGSARTSELAAVWSEES